MIAVVFTLTPAGTVADLVVGGTPFEGWGSVAYAEAPSEVSEGGSHLIIELPVERFTPDAQGLVLWIGEERFRVDLGTRRAPPGGTVACEGSRMTGTLPVMIVVNAGERRFAGRLIPPGEDPAAGWDE
ncbi:MAG: hypothetical protein ABFC89_03965 [Methanospirillum sp.]